MYTVNSYYTVDRSNIYVVFTYYMDYTSVLTTRADYQRTATVYNITHTPIIATAAKRDVTSLYVAAFSARDLTLISRFYF